MWRDAAHPAPQLPIMPRKPPASELDVMAGLRLRAVREVLGYRQETMANLIGVTRTALANWEGGKLPDVRAMVRLLMQEGIPLEWIYAGQVRRVDYERAQDLLDKAAELGAVVGGPVAEWPAAVARMDRARLAARAPDRSLRRRTFHEP